MNRTLRTALYQDADPIRLRLCETGSVCNRYEIDRDKPCIYTGSGRSALDRFFYPVPNGFTCQSDPVWNCTIPGWYRDRVHPIQFRRTRARVDPIQVEPNRTDLV